MNPLKSVGGTIIAGVALAAVILFFLPGEHMVAGSQLKSLVIWLHVLSGITWIGLLYYFNFIQVPALGDALSDEGGPGGAGIAKYIAPRALLWFRWAALATWLTGVTFLHLQGMLHQAFTLGLLGDTPNVYATTIGIGAWLGTIMLFNVWVLIWPNQKKVLGMVEATTDEVATAKKIAFMASRSNTLMSIPMIMSMIGPGHGWLM
ncbi:MAG: urate hydroxylase PuuD [Proteobacteria bacterium]|nr:urate hydroxylase PuuD [Pseudomonadota bacterium]